MKKTLMLCCAFCLLAIPLGVAQVFAGTYGTDITIYDNASAPANGYPATEAMETEPGTIPGHVWDLTAFQAANNNLAIIAGYDLQNGYEGQTLGDLFIKSSSNPLSPAPPYGQNPNGLTNNIVSGYTDGTTNLNSYWGYNYSIRFTFTSNNGGTYVVYTPGDNAMDIMHGSAGGNAGDVSNPWQIGTGWTSYGNGTFTYQTGLTVLDDNNNPYPGGTFNVISGINLSFLHGAPSYLHLTYECGNDNLMGYVADPAGSNVPIPGSLLLLGSGLAGLSLTGLRRRQQVS